MVLRTITRNRGHFRIETSCGLHEGFIYTAGIHGKVWANDKSDQLTNSGVKHNVSTP